MRLDFEAEPEHDFLPRLVTTPRATAYLKIAEGCDHPCTFCIIPQLRGAFRSRSEASILAEARALVDGGAKELILIAQDTSMWGRDRGHRRGGLAELLRAAARDRRARVDSPALPLSGDGRSRADRRHRRSPEGLQVHGYAAAARASRRCCARCAGPSNGERYLEILDDFRARVPGITMRSTFIVGFPGETEEHVDYLRRAGSLARGSIASGSSSTAPRKERRRPNSPRTHRRRAAPPAADPLARGAARRVGARAARCGGSVRVLAEERAAARSAIRFEAGRREHGSGARKVKRRASMAASISPAKCRGWRVR